MSHAPDTALRRFHSPAVRQSAALDELVREAVFGGPEEREQARWLIWEIGQTAGVRPASIHELYLARGRGEVPPFTTPAINVRVLSYDSARAISLRQQGRLEIFGSAETLAEIARRFGYIFDEAPAPPGTSKPELTAHPLDADRETEIAGMAVLPLALPHGDRTVFGYRMGALAYLTDAKAIPEMVRARLTGLDVLVLNALLPRPHPLHLSIPEAVDAAARIGARRTFLTHLTHDTPHAELAARLPAGIAPAYDGLVIDVGSV